MRDDPTRPVEPAWQAPVRRYAPTVLVICLLVLLAMVLATMPVGGGTWTPWRLTSVSLIFLGLVILLFYRTSLIRRLEEAEEHHVARAETLALFKDRLNAALNHIEDGVISTDVDGVVTVINNKAAELTGWSVHEALDRPLDEVFRLRKDAAAAEPALTAAELRKAPEFAGQNTGTLEPRGGDERAIHYRKLPALDADGWLVGMVLVIHDVTELRAAERQRETLIRQLSESNALLEAEIAKSEKARRAALSLMQDAQQAQAAVHEREQNLRVLFEGIDDVLLVYDEAGRVLDANHAACARLGYSHTELLGLAMRQIVVPDDEHWQSQCYQTRSGQRFPVDVHASKIGYRGAQATLSVARDIAELTRVQNELRESNQRLQESNAALEEYARVASHDLQEPLRKIESFAQVVVEDYGQAVDEQGRRYLRIMAEAAKRMRRLIKDVLAFSRAGADDRPFEPVDLNEVLGEVRDNLFERIREKSARLDAQPLPVIQGDRTQMIQLFQNLVGNGIKFNENSTPRVDVFARENHNQWTIFVRDNGIGISPSEIRYLFAPFKRLHGRDKYDGTGIGLAICRRIALRHGGSIGLESEPGAGTTFQLTLPKKRPTSWLTDHEKAESVLTEGKR